MSKSDLKRIRTNIKRMNHRRKSIVKWMWLNWLINTGRYSYPEVTWDVDVSCGISIVINMGKDHYKVEFVHYPTQA